MQPTAHVAALVGGVITLLLIATVTRAVTRRLKLPFTVMLVLVGISLAAVSAVYPHVLPVLHDLEISSALIFYVFLPTLIFEGCVPPFTRGVIGHEIGLVLDRELRPLVQDYP